MLLPSCFEREVERLRERGRERDLRDIHTATICAKFKFVSESNIFRGDGWKRERESCKEWHAERYYNALLSSERVDESWEAEECKKSGNPDLAGLL